MPEEKSTNPQPTVYSPGQYYLLEKIAQGGMAEIYKGLAYDLAGIKKIVCIKKILPHISASQEFIDMLIDEAKIAVQLNHGSIAQIHDLGKVNEDYFIVMDFVEGQNLSRLNKRVLRQNEKIPIPLACYIVAEVASGLNYMHRKTDEFGNSLNIIHRDISPQNIMVSYSGTVKIIDFGIAKAASKIGHTELGILKGKFAYMSPEQARGDVLDPRSDIFSLGVILHELLTGKRLFKASENKETLRNVRRASVSPPSSLNPDIPEELDAIVLKALSRNPKKRYAYASEFHEALMRFVFSHYTNFRPAQLSEFVQKQFANELDLLQSRKEEEGATPHLMLDKTYSSLRAQGEEKEVTSGGREMPINWREFMLELDWPDEPVEQADDEEEWEDSNALELTTKKTNPYFSYGVGLTALIILIVLFFPQINGFFKRPQEEKPAAQGTTVEKLPVLSSWVIESDPPGANIFLDDRETGLKTPATLGPFPVGEKHQIGLFLEKHFYYKSLIESSGGATEHLHAQLVLNYGSLKILSTPSGADVFINEENVGKTPMIREKLPPEEILTIHLSLEGYEAWKKTVKVRPGKEELISKVLAKKRPSPIINDNEKEK